MIETAFLVVLHERVRAHKVPLWALIASYLSGTATPR